MANKGEDVKDDAQISKTSEEETKINGRRERYRRRKGRQGGGGATSGEEKNAGWRA